MKATLFTGIVIGMALVFAPATMAKSKKKTTSKAITGVYCSQGPDNVHFTASQFTAKQRQNMRVGQRAKINIAGIGPIDCKVY
jgi:hypothetical protein